MGKPWIGKMFAAAALCALTLCQTGFTGVLAAADAGSDAVTSDSSLNNPEGENMTEETKSTFTAVYLGVAGYGRPEVNKENKPWFRYRFLSEGQELVLPMDNGTADMYGEFDYPLQNRLKEGYTYTLETENGVVKHVTEQTSAMAAGQTGPAGTGGSAEGTSGSADGMPALPVRGTPGVKTLRNFLATAVEPVGQVLYIYGGGWDWQDKGSALQTRSIGLSPDWTAFFRSKDADFNYKNMNPEESYYPFGGFNEYYYAGLDCSGYLGWVIYNTMNRENGKEGYVTKSGAFARSLAARGWGAMAGPGLQSGLCPGDIVSIDGHVWISLGTCSDGSVVILHSTPSLSRNGMPGGGVQIGAVGFDENCEAFLLADRYMALFYPEWYGRYRTSLKGPAAYLYCPGGATGRFTWDVSGNGALTDPEGMQKMDPATVLRSLFGE